MCWHLFPFPYLKLTSKLSTSLNCWISSMAVSCYVFFTKNKQTNKKTVKTLLRSLIQNELRTSSACISISAASPQHLCCNQNTHWPNSLWAYESRAQPRLCAEPTDSHPDSWGDDTLSLLALCLPISLPYVLRTSPNLIKILTRCLIPTRFKSN